MMMPMLSEARTEGMTLDASRVCAKELHYASAIVILGTSGMYYWLTGFFGAAQ